MATIEEFRQLQFKVARILEAKLHPNADRLLILKVDTGEVQKEVVAGIARHYAPSDLAGKLVVIVDNMEPATIRGVISQGMVLAAQDGDNLSLIVSERLVAPGAPVR